MSFIIYISTFGKKVKKVAHGRPIEVGAACRDHFLYELKDNTGDNISAENPYYAELTGLYWVWKNVKNKPDDIIGFCHFNKSLLIDPVKANDLIRKKGYRFIVCRHQAIPQMVYPEDYKALLSIVRDKHPKYYRALYELYGQDGSSSKCNGKNTFITTRKDFDKYCTFLFDVLGECRRVIGAVEERPTQRYVALLAERLLSVYLKTENISYYEADIEYDRPLLTVSKAIINRLPFSGNSPLLYKLRKQFAKSSYH